MILLFLILMMILNFKPHYHNEISMEGDNK